MSQGIKPWQNRVSESYSEAIDGPTLSPINAACAEIADLRAELQRRCRAQGGGTNDKGSAIATSEQKEPQA